MWTRGKASVILADLHRAVRLQPALTAALLLSILLSTAWNPSLPSEGLHLGTPVRITGRIASPPRIERSPDQIVFELEPSASEQRSESVEVGERVSVYVASSTGPPETWFEPPLCFGEIVRFRSRLKEPAVYRVPGVQDRRWSRWAGGRYFSIGLKSPAQLERLGHSRALRIVLVRPLIDLQSSFRAFCERRLSPLPAALLAAALTGDRSAVPSALWDRLERLSLIHLLVVSGFHIGLLVWILGTAALRCGTTGRLLRLAIVWVFAASTGLEAPVSRAALVLTLLEIAVLWGLRSRLFNILGAAAFLHLIAFPRSIYSRSFQFTFLSVAAILALLPFLRILESAAKGAADIGRTQVLVRRDRAQRLRRLVRFRLECWGRFLPPRPTRAVAVGGCRALAYLAAAAAITASIQLALTPLLLYYTNQWVLTAVPNNVAALPLFSLFFAAGLLLFLLHWTPAAAIVAPAVDLLGRWFAGLLHRLEATNQIAYLPAPSPLLLAVCFLLLAVTLVPGRIRLWALPACPLLLVAALGFGRPPTSSWLSVTLLDVGQAEAIHLRYPDGSDALVDTGGSRFESGNRFLGRRVLARYLLHERTRQLDFVLITHPESDHLGALPALSRVFRPHRLYHFAPLPFPAPAEQRLLHAGDDFWLGGVHHLVHNPPPSSPLSIPANANSIVLEVRFGSFSMLLTGDIDARVERRLLSRLAPIDLLKIAHHGSRTGTSISFLRTIRPRAAILSAGRENMFGHPSRSVLQRLEEVGCPVFSTAREGSLRIRTNGRVWRIARFDLETDRFVELASGLCGSASARLPGGSLQVEEAEIR